MSQSSSSPSPSPKSITSESHTSQFSRYSALNDLLGSIAIAPPARQSGNKEQVETHAKWRPGDLEIGGNNRAGYNPQHESYEARRSWNGGNNINTSMPQASQDSMSNPHQTRQHFTSNTTSSGSTSPQNARAGEPTTTGNDSSASSFRYEKVSESKAQQESATGSNVRDFLLASQGQYHQQANNRLHTSDVKSERQRLCNSLFALKRAIKRNLNKLTVEKFTTICEEIAQMLEEAQDLDQVQCFADLIVDASRNDQHFAEVSADSLLVLRFRCPQRLNEMDQQRVRQQQDEKGHCDIPVLSRNAMISALANKLETDYHSLPRSLNEPMTVAPNSLCTDDEDELKMKRKRGVAGLFILLGHLFIRKITPINLVASIVSERLMESDPDEDYVECSCKLLLTIGATLDTSPRGCAFLDQALARLDEIAQNCSNRLQFVIEDLVEARNRCWIKKSYLDRLQATRRTKDEETKECTRKMEGPIPDYAIIGQRRNVESDYVEYIHKQERLWTAKLKGETIDPSPLNENLRKPALVTFSVPLDRSWHYDPDHPPSFRPAYLFFDDLGATPCSQRVSSTNSVCSRRPQTPMQRPRSASSYTGGIRHEDEEDEGDEDEGDEGDEEEDDDDDDEDEAIEENEREDNSQYEK